MKLQCHHTSTGCDVCERLSSALQTFCICADEGKQAVDADCECFDQDSLMSVTPRRVKKTSDDLSKAGHCAAGAELILNPERRNV